MNFYHNSRFVFGHYICYDAIPAPAEIRRCKRNTVFHSAITDRQTLAVMSYLFAGRINKLNVIGRGIIAAAGNNDNFAAVDRD